MSIDNFTNEFNSTEDSIFVIDTAVIIIEICLSIITVILNLLNIVLISICINQKKTYSNIIFLLNSIADFIVGLISLPGDVVLAYTDGDWRYSIIICVFYKTFDFANSNFSLMLLLVITIHRLLQLKDPFKQKEEMNRWRWVLIFMLLAFNYGVWLAFWYIYFHKKENENVCYMKTFEIYIYVYNCLITIGTFILIILMNILIIREFIIKKSKNLGNKSKREDNAIYCIIAITVNLILCWSFLIFTWPIIRICTECVPDKLYTISFLLNYSFLVIISLVFKLYFLMIQEFYDLKKVSFIFKKNYKHS
jgi:hypothetical protein